MEFFNRVPRVGPRARRKSVGCAMPADSGVFRLECGQVVAFADSARFCCRWVRRRLHSRFPFVGALFLVELYGCPALYQGTPAAGILDNAKVGPAQSTGPEGRAQRVFRAAGNILGGVSKIFPKVEKTCLLRRGQPGTIPIAGYGAGCALRSAWCLVDCRWCWCWGCGGTPPPHQTVGRPHYR